MNRQCPGCPGNGRQIASNGSYFRKNDSRRIRRFVCRACGLYFSSATFSPNYRQKKRRINHAIAPLMCSLVSQRRMALSLKVSRTTIARKLKFLAGQIRLRQRQQRPPDHLGTAIQFDDLETFEHTKCKPLTVTVVIDADRQSILGCCVAPIAAKGRLAAVSRQKYGPRTDTSRIQRDALLAALKSQIAPTAVFRTDGHGHYSTLIRRHYPQATHHQHIRRDHSISGQGVLKKKVFDPLFGINQVHAMLRANINRLIRKTWCTTKRMDALADHLVLYMDYHNRVLRSQYRYTVNV